MHLEKDAKLNLITEGKYLSGCPSMLKSVPANYQYRKCTRFRRPFFFLWSHRLVECFAFLKNVSGCTFFFQKNCNDFSLTFFFFFLSITAGQNFILIYISMIYD